MVPATAGVTDRDPEVICVPDQSVWPGFADAVQVVASMVDQVRVTDWPTPVVCADSETLTVGGEATTCPMVVLPPPQPARKDNAAPETNVSGDFFIAPPQDRDQGERDYRRDAPEYWGYFMLIAVVVKLSNLDGWGEKVGVSQGHYRAKS